MAGRDPPRQLVVTAQRVDQRVEITVYDTGPGIAEPDIERLFKPFFTTKPNGMGMGLAICRTTVESHGGQLTVESRLGQGASFRITLPSVPS
jgi:signal transduction histidine kinase